MWFEKKKALSFTHHLCIMTNEFRVDLEIWKIMTLRVVFLDFLKCIWLLIKNEVSRKYSLLSNEKMAYFGGKCVIILTRKTFLF